MIATAVLIAAPAAAWAVIPPPPQPVETACDNLGTICATSSAAAAVSCGQIDIITIQCSGSATVGGSGESPVGLPGSVSWTGSATCSGDCGIPQNGELSGVAAWPGLGVSGAGSEGQIILGTVTKTLIGCLSMTVTAVADAKAQTLLSVPGVIDLGVTEATAPQAVHEATESICFPI